MFNVIEHWYQHWRMQDSVHVTKWKLGENLPLRFHTSLQNIPASKLAKPFNSQDPTSNFPSDHHTKGESWLLYFDDALWLPTLSVLISYLQYNILESQWEVTCGSHLAVKRFKGKKILKNLRWFFSQCKVLCRNFRLP